MTKLERLELLAKENPSANSHVTIRGLTMEIFWMRLGRTYRYYYAGEFQTREQAELIVEHGGQSA